MKGKEIGLKTDCSSDNNEQLMFEEEMRKLEEQMENGDIVDDYLPYKKVHKCKEQIHPDREREINNQIFGKVETENCKNEMENLKESEIDFTNESDDSRNVIRKVKDATLQHKKATKCIFLGDFFNQCTNKRKPADRWYFYSKEMIESIDQNEQIMNSALIRHGHSKIEEMMSRHGGEEWNGTLDSKMKNLAEGLKSIEDMICKEGMTTVWGTFINRGTTLNRIRGAFKRGKRVRGLIDYVKYKSRRWESHYKKVVERMKHRDLYY